ncbi:MAG: hypothetical protein C5B55_05475 [Blastocatellia bacterium]|nr:MAG: hypothetical protein C5B55_05475 [Blastocatellia bacterium]
MTQIKQDSRGFIWMIAGDGISRFDGYTFTNYTTDDGLPDRRVNDLLETRSGVYWIATESGLCRFNPTGDRVRSPSFGSPNENREVRNEQSAIRNSDNPMFSVFNPGEKPIAFNVLLEDDTGAIWCGTHEGLFRLKISSDGSVHFHEIDLGMRLGLASDNVAAILKDHQGALWIGKGGVLYRLLADGRVERYTQQNGLGSTAILSLLEDRDGNIWVGSQGGLGGTLRRLVTAPDPSRSIVARVYNENDGLPSMWVNSLLQTPDGRLWVATNFGLYVSSAETEKGARSFRHYNAKNGSCEVDVWALTEDRDDNLWVASMCGAIKVAHNGFTGYGLDDGFNALFIDSIFENRDGELFATNAPSTVGLTDYEGRRINKFDGARFTPVEPNLPSDIKYHGWGWNQTILQDHTGEWWIPTGSGLYRFPKVDRIEELAHVRTKFVSTVGDDSNRTEIFRLYEDARGDVWIATTGVHFGLLRWERATNTVHDHTAETGVPPKTDFTAFIEDRTGNLWIGTSETGGLLRYRDGRFSRFTTADGVPPGWVISLYLDRSGRLWIASQLGGLNRIDDPAADTLHIVRYTTLNGLSSNNIRSITEDLWGRIYAGTGHGVDRIDLANGNVKHYTVADGLPKNGIEHAYRDRNGALWFGSPFGLSRLIPEEHETHSPPSVFLTGVRVEGIVQRVSELGETNLPQVELDADQHQLSVDFVGLAASVGDELRYQYRLEGADSDWNAPTTQHTVNYARLASGHYRFLVRAINSEGAPSLQPASISFTILPHIYQRWWFATLAGFLLVTIGYVGYRSRVARLLGIERVRTRIAADLHDDIGANLTRIAILSEVAHQQLHDTHPSAAGPLSSIARISRESVASMSDIVWAVNPRRDSLLDLVLRMRSFANEVLAGRQIEFQFDAPDRELSQKLGAELRRDVFLIFKEALNNAVRHSGCTHVTIELRLDQFLLVLVVRDDGCGFAPSDSSEGHGLVSMQRRAKAIGGELQLQSQADKGTKVSLSVPRRRWV